MKLRPFGRSGFALSEIGFGCGPGARLMVGEPRAEQAAAVGHALELGVTYFDTAAIYGDGTSETNLGRALGDASSRVTIGTKVALQWDELDDIAGNVVRSIEGSLRRLGRDRVEIVYLHNRVAAQRAEKADIGVGAMLTVADVLGEAGVVAGFRTARERGLVGAFGCCGYGGEAAAVDAVTASGAIDAMLVHYSQLNPSAFAPLPAGSARRDYAGIGARAAERGVSAVALRVLEAGELTSSPEQVAAAIRFALANPAVATVLIGVSEPAHIEAAARAAAAASSAR